MITIEVDAPPESKAAIEAALADKELLCTVTIIGLLKPLSRSAQMRIVCYVRGWIEEQRENE